jgi:site-specific DNA-methyltransferase (adenine-specific)
MTIQGRWPANILLDEDAAAMLDEQSGVLKSGNLLPGHKRGQGRPIDEGGWYVGGGIVERSYGGDTGGASRFFYVTKASRSERDAGVKGEAKSGAELTDRKEVNAGLDNPRAGAGRTSGGKNTHPTVKPIQLLRYLVRLVTPPGGTVLDPFAGSGTTGIAATLEGFGFLGIELSEDYAQIALQRIAHHST